MKTREMAKQQPIREASDINQDTSMETSEEALPCGNLPILDIPSGHRDCIEQESKGVN